MGEQASKSRFQRNKGYYFRTAFFMLLCVTIVFLQRWEELGILPLIFTVNGITISTTDFFMIVGAGICGYIYGVGGFILLFIGEIARTLPETLSNVMDTGNRIGGPVGQGELSGGGPGNAGEMLGQIASSIGQGLGGGQHNSAGVGYFAMFIYLMLVLLSGYFARKRWYKGVVKPLLAMLIFTIFLGSSLYVTMTYFSVSTTYYQDMTLMDMYIGVVPEIILAVTLLTLYYRFVPDRVKERIGVGHLYTEEYDEYLKTAPIRENSPLGKRMLFLVMGQTLLLSIFAVIVFDLQMNGMMPGGGPRGMELVKLDIQMILLITCVALPITMAIHEIVQRIMVKPLNQMTTVMKNYFSSEEDVRHKSVEGLKKLKIHTGDEIETLHNALNLMVADMSGYIDVMKHEMELKESLAAAEAESKAKSAFLSSMSHEIRTPINAVLGMDEMILRESKEEQTLEYAENIRTAGNSLLGLVNDILDFSKIEAGKMDIIPVEYEFASVLNDLVNMIKQRSEDKGLSLVVEADKNIPSLLYGDEIRFKQVVTNILTNAVKYTNEGSVTLSVRADKVDEEHIDLYVSVADTGIGIKEEDLEKLFSAFERIEEERNRNVEGTGLGMSITKQLLAMMDSRLEVQSVYGEGSTFSFHLVQKVIKWEPIGDFEEALRRSYANRKKYHETFVAPDCRVLVVDDTPMNLTVFKGLLKKTRLAIDTADSGFACLDKLTEHRYDMIFLDHRMPKMDGIETKHRMEELSGNLNVDTPVIALTANAVSGAREEYISNGFQDYLTKPIDTRALEAMLVKYLPADKVEIQKVEDAENPTGETRKTSRNFGVGTNTAEASGAVKSGGDRAAGDFMCGAHAGKAEAFGDSARTDVVFDAYGNGADGRNGAFGAGMHTDGAVDNFEGGTDTSCDDERQDGSGFAGGGMELPAVDGLDWSYARMHLPDDELLKEAVCGFYDIIDLHADRLNSFYNMLPDSDAFDEYRILVHGMKSSAATIGIIPLAGMAKMLEDAAGARDLEQIYSLHNSFIRRWCSYKQGLFGVFGLGAENDTEKPAYDGEVLDGLLDVIAVSMEEFDVDSADNALSQIEMYSYPEEIQTELTKLKAAVADVDSDAAIEIARKLQADKRQTT